MKTCPSCGSKQFESDSASGNTYCTDCGTVLEENAIVSEITFGESSSGAAIVNGSFVSADSSGARIAGPFKNQSSQSSREHTLFKGRQRIGALALAMRIPERLADSAHRYFTLAVVNKFVQGRRSQYVVASCLYVVCRMEKTSHMLIDFADVLNINVFVLGSTFLKLMKALHISLPTVDPSLYISRFAAMLEFGADTQKVANDAIRLVSRMKRDWMHQGRRPSGICGACLLLSARMNNYMRSMAEIIHVVKVGDNTVKKRLAEFSETPSSQLTVGEFRSTWLEESANPPSFDRKPKRKRGIIKKQETVDPEAEGDQEEQEEEACSHESTEAESEMKLQMLKEFKVPYPKIQSHDERSTATEIEVSNSQETAAKIAILEDDNVDKEVESEIAQGLESEVEDVLNDPELQDMVVALGAAKNDPCKEDAHDGGGLSDVDDEEIGNFFLNEKEVGIKTQVWMELNKEYLAEQENKRLKAATDKKHGIRKGGLAKKRRRVKARDSTAPDLPASPAESAKQMMQERTFSKKINYAAFEHLFAAD